jgi:hypothetical protein
MLRRAGEAQIHTDYAARLAGLALCTPPRQFAAAAQRLREQREATLEAFRCEIHASEKAQRDREIGLLSATEQDQRPASHHRVILRGKRRIVSRDRDIPSGFRRAAASVIRRGSAPARPLAKFRNNSQVRPVP